MIPIKFKEANKELIRPRSMADKECGTLPVFAGGTDCISCWKPTWQEWLSFLIYRRIWLYVYGGSTQPPVVITISKTVF